MDSLVKRLADALREIVAYVDGGKNVHTFDAMLAQYRREVLEEAAKVCDARKEEILGKQSNRAGDPVDVNLRMIAHLGCAEDAAIDAARAAKEN